MKKSIIFVAIFVAHLSYATPPIYGESNFDEEMIQSAILLLQVKSPDGEILCSNVNEIRAEIIQEKITKHEKKYSKELWHLSGCDGTKSVIATLYPSRLVGIQNAERSIGKSASNGHTRNSQEISRTMDQHNAAIYLVYKKALLKNHTLQGKMTVKIVIDSMGKVVEAEIVSSKLNDSELENAILRRIRLITFSPSKVAQTIVNYNFNFLSE